jgi:hypothetical protein
MVVLSDGINFVEVAGPVFELSNRFANQTKPLFSARNNCSSQQSIVNRFFKVVMKQPTQFLIWTFLFH